MLEVEIKKSTYSTTTTGGAWALGRPNGKDSLMDHSYHQRITMDRFTFVSNAQQAQGAGFVSQLSIDSGEGTARYQRFFYLQPRV